MWTMITVTDNSVVLNMKCVLTKFTFSFREYLFSMVKRIHNYESYEDCLTKAGRESIEDK